MHKQMENYRGVKLNKATCQQITAEIMLTYDLYKFAIERSELHASPHIHVWIGHTHIWIYMDKTIWENALYVG